MFSFNPTTNPWVNIKCGLMKELHSCDVGCNETTDTLPAGHFINNAYTKIYDFSNNKNFYTKTDNGYT